MRININRKRLLVSLNLLTISLLTVIYIESAQPPPKIFGLISGLDKIGHFTVYSILGVILLAMLTLIGYRKYLALSLSVCLVLIAGIFDEFHQQYVPLRNSDVWDLLADFCGGLFAISVLSPFIKTGKINHVQT
jgi:VanZ family protein